MRIKVINPNTTQSMTALISRSLESVLPADCEVVCVSPAMGPASIESHYDEALAVPGLLQETQDGEREGFDGYVVACFGDPGVQAAREISSVPVIGIAEGAFHAAALLGSSFSVVTTLERTIGRAHELLVSSGLGVKCAGVHACEIAVLELENPESHALDKVEELSRLALEKDGSQAIVLGCAGMAGYVDQLSSRLGVPVVDGVAATVLLTYSLATLRLKPAKIGEQAYPPPKKYSGLLEGFTI